MLLAINIGAIALTEKFLIILDRITWESLFSGFIILECKKTLVLITNRIGFLNVVRSYSNELKESSFSKSR